MDEAFCTQEYIVVLPTMPSSSLFLVLSGSPNTIFDIAVQLPAPAFSLKAATNAVLSVLLSSHVSFLPNAVIDVTNVSISVFPAPFAGFLSWLSNFCMRA